MTTSADVVPTQKDSNTTSTDVVPAENNTPPTPTASPGTTATASLPLKHPEVLQECCTRSLRTHYLHLHENTGPFRAVASAWGAAHGSGTAEEALPLVEMEHHEQREALSCELDMLQRQLESAQNELHARTSDVLRGRNYAACRAHQPALEGRNPDPTINFAILVDFLSGTYTLKLAVDFVTTFARASTAVPQLCPYKFLVKRVHTVPALLFLFAVSDFLTLEFLVASHISEETDRQACDELLSKKEKVAQPTFSANTVTASKSEYKFLDMPCTPAIPRGQNYDPTDCVSYPPSVTGLGILVVIFTVEIQKWKFYDGPSIHQL
ncbi:hypothetical protein B0H17DRAFT_1151133 [Mycena rosella]|uniref:Uncharacterized protein n=1 Tax=Mycena rosella TaxID=1033263 RepID=A0AAD7FHX2_MYCRO|nr:hypothetical protein B0H17DRAFT_1151133 [Mycena rosella]